MSVNQPPAFAPPVAAPVSTAAPTPFGPAAPFGPATPGSWAPPPKPGLIPLRPLGLGVVLSASFVVLRKSPGALLVPALLLSLASASIGAGIAAMPVDWANPDPISTALRETAPWAIGVFISVVLDGIAAIAVTQGALGRRMGFRALLRQAKGRDKRLVIWAFLVGGVVYGVAVGIRALGTLTTASDMVASVVTGLLGVLVGIPLLAAAALWLGTKLAFVPAALMIERARFGAAIRRSWQLTKGAFWRIAGIRLLVWVMLVIASAIVAFPFSMLFGFGGGLLYPNGGDPSVYDAVAAVVLSVIPALTAALGAVVGGATVGLLYIDTRMRREALDLDLTRYVEAPDAALDPFLPKAD